MPVLGRLRKQPPSALGRPRHDALIWLADTAISGMWGLSGALRRPSPPPAHDRRLALTVVDRRVVAHDQDVVAVTLGSVGEKALPRWHPGAHLDVHLPSGRVRQYSLCGDPAADSYRIAVRRIPDGGGGSAEVHDRLSIGTPVTAFGPRNAFPLVVPGRGSPAHRFRFAAGGIGVTPILPMIGLADRLGIDWSMAYTGRSHDSLPFLDELTRYGERISVRTDDVAGLPTAADLLGDCPDGTAVYACGPAPMLDAIRGELTGRAGVELHYERFGAAPVVDGTAFGATVASTGQTISVTADETLLAALGRAGVDAPYSCQQGFCGTCRIRVLDGVVVHRDTLLTGPERAGGAMLTCVSRAADGGHLTLDL